MATTFITPTEVSFTKDSNWYDVDCSSLIASGASGVIVEVRSTSTSGSGHYQVGLRKNGSSDTRVGRHVDNGHSWHFIGVDSNRIFEAFASHSSIQVWVHGYTGSEATYFTNAINATPGSNFTWTDKDLSADTGASTAIAVMVLHTQAALVGWTGARCNGSTDARSTRSSGFLTSIIKCDGSEIIETYRQDSTCLSYVVGYFTSNAVLTTNATDVSLGSTGSYADITTLTNSDAVAGIYEITKTAGGYGNKFNIRDDGGTFDYYNNPSWEHSFCVAKCSAGKICEGKIEVTSVDFFYHGDLTGVAFIRRVTMVN
jgi:hypothetical protein